MSAIQGEITAALRFAALVAQLVPGAGTVVGQVLSLAPSAISLVSSVIAMAANNRAPTADEEAKLNALIAENSATLHAAAERARAALAQG